MYMVDSYLHDSALDTCLLDLSGFLVLNLQENVNARPGEVRKKHFTCRL